MSSSRYILYVLIGVAAIAILICGRTIFPIMGDDEYFIDKNGCIHGNNCPCKDTPWFTEKHSKYTFKKMKGTYFCRDCFFFDEEISKLMSMHRYNIEIEIKRLQMGGASDDYIDNKVEQYEW